MMRAGDGFGLDRLTFAKGVRWGAWLNRVPGFLFAVSLILAVFAHLDFSVSESGAISEDWFLHLLNAIQIHSARFDSAQIMAFYRASPHNVIHYTPLAYLASAAVMDTGWLDVLASTYASRALWIIVLGVSLYGAGKRLGGSPWAGLIAVSFGGLSTQVLFAARSVSLEFPMYAAFAFVCYAQTFTDGFRRLTGSIVLGLAIGTAFLVKMPVLVYAGPYLAAEFVRAFIRRGDEADPRWRRLGYASAACVVAALLMAMYVVPLALHPPQTMLWAQYTPQVGGSVFAANLAYVWDVLPVQVFDPAMGVFTFVVFVVLLIRRDGYLATLLFASVFASVFFVMHFHMRSTQFFPLFVLLALGLGRVCLRAPRPLVVIAAGFFAFVYLIPAWFQAGDPPDRDASPFSGFFYSVVSRADGLPAGFPRDRANGRWDAVLWSAHLLETRYAGTGVRRVGIIDYFDENGEQLPASCNVWNALALVVGDPSRMYNPGDTAVFMPGDEYPSDEVIRKTWDRDVVVTLVPVEPERRETEPVRRMIAALKRMPADYRVDLRLRIEMYPGQSFDLVYMRRAHRSEPAVPTDGPALAPASEIP